MVAHSRLGAARLLLPLLLSVMPGPVPVLPLAKMELREMVSPAPALTSTPTWLLSAIRLPAPRTLPPMVLVEPMSATPMLLPRPLVPETLVPMELASTCTAETPLSINMPSERLPEMRLPWRILPNLLITTPPMVLLDAATSTPMLLATAAVPVALVPMKLYCTATPETPIYTPSALLPEIILPAPAAPIVLLDAETTTPYLLARATVPA